MNSNTASQQPAGQWSTGLFGCFEDCSSCWSTACVPFVTFGRMAHILDRGETTCFAAGISLRLAGSFYSYKYRTKLRSLYSLPEEPCGDFCVHCWCTYCAICQEYRELKNRGLDPSEGWAINAPKMEGGATKAPSVATGMAR